MSMTTTRTPLKGYSLVELIVAVGIFSMVMLIVTGVYLSLISYDRQARAINQLVANLSFALESMGRNIRTGTDYPTTCGVVPCSSFAFETSNGESVSYALSGGRLTVTVDGFTSPITDEAITITNVRFYVRGAGTTGANEVVQPRVTILVNGTMPTDAGKDVDFVLQTTATQRLLDIP